MTVLIRGVLLIGVWVTGVRIQEPAKCPEGRAPTGDLRIRRLECVGDACAVSLRDSLGGWYHDFSVEPRVGAVDPDSQFQPGDALVAIDGWPVTSREGGRRLANLTVGSEVKVTVRRRGRVSEVTALPKLGCNLPGLSVRVMTGRD